MSTLKVNKLRDTAGSADAITLDPNGGAVLAGVTTVTSVKVGAAVTISESGIEASGIGITCANINGTQIGGRRNLIINGDFRIAQRGTSSTSSGYYTVDRFQVNNSGTDEAPTQAQVDVASGTTPYTLGFRKALKITNGNQTSGAGTADFIRILYYIEAQDLANSGWDYTNPNSYITLSYWVKSSVAQTYYTNFRSYDGTQQMYYFSYALSADTWTKVTKTISGNSNITFDNDNGQGMYIQWYQYRGTDNTGTVTANQWNDTSTSTLTPDQTSTWYTTNDAVFRLTGVQLEVGSQATPFEHRSFGEELALCQRYFEICYGGYYGYISGSAVGGAIDAPVDFKVTKRADATLTEISEEENCTTSVTVVGANLSSQKESAHVRAGSIVSGATGNGKYFFSRFSASAEL